MSFAFPGDPAPEKVKTQTWYLVCSFNTKNLNEPPRFGIYTDPNPTHDLARRQFVVGKEEIPETEPSSLAFYKLYCSHPWAYQVMTSAEKKHVDEWSSKKGDPHWGTYFGPGRWETGIRNIVTALFGARQEFTVEEVVAAVKNLQANVRATKEHA